MHQLNNATVNFLIFSYHIISLIAHPTDSRTMYRTYTVNFYSFYNGREDEYFSRDESAEM